MIPLPAVSKKYPQRWLREIGSNAHPFCGLQRGETGQNTKKREISLQIPIRAGKSLGDWFAPDCVHRQTIPCEPAARHCHGIDVSYETVRAWWNRFGPLFAAKIRKNRSASRNFSLWRRHLDEVVTDSLRSCRAAMRKIGIETRQETGRWLNNQAENSLQPGTPSLPPPGFQD